MKRQTENVITDLFSDTSFSHKSTPENTCSLTSLFITRLDQILHAFECTDTTFPTSARELEKERERERGEGKNIRIEKGRELKKKRGWYD